jgi:hypothetical protein
VLAGKLVSVWVGLALKLGETLKVAVGVAVKLGVALWVTVRVELEPAVSVAEPVGLGVTVGVVQAPMSCKLSR